MPRRLTLKAARSLLQDVSMSIQYRREVGEYRVNFIGRGEATAYYTGDLYDAVLTAVHMRVDDFISTYKRLSSPTIEGEENLQ